MSSQTSGDEQWAYLDLHNFTAVKKTVQKLRKVIFLNLAPVEFTNFEIRWISGGLLYFSMALLDFKGKNCFIKILFVHASDWWLKFTKAKSPIKHNCVIVIEVKEPREGGKGYLKLPKFDLICFTLPQIFLFIHCLWQA